MSFGTPGVRIRIKDEPRQSKEEVREILDQNGTLRRFEDRYFSEKDLV
jgi:hypothetical protein